jgi:hypothetical protein
LQAVESSLVHGLWGRELADEGPSDPAVPKALFEAGGEARQASFQVFADLATELGRLPHQVTALPYA